MFALEWGIWYLCRGRSFVGMTILGVVVFGMGDLFLTQGSLLCGDDKVWVGGGLTNLAITHHYFVLPRYEESLCLGVILMKNILFFGVLLEIVYLRRGGSFVGMTILGGCFGMWDLFLTQGSLLRRDDKVWYLRRGGSFVGMIVWWMEF